ncbi:MAG: type IV pilus biogenesis/stability protein PilW [Glaciecola sp.]
MLKKIIIVLIVASLGACAAKPSDTSFVGAGEFNADEAAKTRVSLGLTYLKNGNFSQAKFNLDKALEFAPRSGEAHYAMAYYYQQVEEVTRAEEYYESAIGYSRNDPDVLNSYGAFLCMQGRYDEAKTYFLEAVDDKRYIATAETYENLAICAQSQGFKEQAMEYFAAALNHQPTRASTLFFVAQNHIESGNWSDAKKALWKYERNASVTADSLWMSFQIARGENNLKGALEYADILNRLHPDHPKAKQALALLGKFQPVMAVSQKNKVQTTTQTAPTNTEASSTVASDGQTKSSKVLTPTPTEPTNNQLSSVNKNQNETKVTGNDELVSPKVQFHVVQAKENLYRISLKYNVKMKKLLEWNNLKDASSIRIGTKLRVRDPKTNE